MLLDSTALLLVSLGLIIIGLYLVRCWRFVGDIVAMTGRERLLFGPGGPKLLIVLGLIGIGGGALGAAHAISNLMLNI